MQEKRGRIPQHHGRGRRHGSPRGQGGKLRSYLVQRVCQSYYYLDETKHMWLMILLDMLIFILKHVYILMLVMLLVLSPSCNVVDLIHRHWLDVLNIH